MVFTSETGTEKKVTTAIWARHLADGLTLFRFLGALALALWPWLPGSHAVHIILIWNMILWSTDVIDGPLARYSGTPPTRIGEADEWSDVILAFCTAVAIVRLGFFSPLLLIAWLLLFIVLHIVYPVKTIKLLFNLPLVILPLVIGLVVVPVMGLIYICWIIVIAVFGWGRLQGVIDDFISGLPSSWQGWIFSWLPRWLKYKGKEED